MNTIQLMFLSKLRKKYSFRKLYEQIKNNKNSNSPVLAISLSHNAALSEREGPSLPDKVALHDREMDQKTLD